MKAEQWVAADVAATGFSFLFVFILLDRTGNV